MTVVRRDELPAPSSSTISSSHVDAPPSLNRCTIEMPDMEPDVALRASASGPLAAALRRCAEASSSTEARMMVKFAIETDGCVRDVSVVSEAANPSVDKCVAATFAALRFARPADGTAVVLRYPIVVTRARP